MASHDVVRCRACATLVSPPITTASTCPKCRAALHSCAQCASFDPASRFQCMQAVPAPVSPKDAAAFREERPVFWQQADLGVFCVECLHRT